MRGRSSRKPRPSSSFPLRRTSARSAFSRSWNDTRRSGGRNRSAHHAVLLSLGPVVAEAGLFIEAARGVVEELGPHLLARLQFVRIALHHAAARLRNQVDGTAQRHPCDAFPPIVPVDEDAGDAIVGRLVGAGRLVLLPVVDVRQLLRGAVLAPGHRGVAVEDQGRVRVALANEPLLPGAALLALGPALSRMEPRAPAAAEPTPLVLVQQARVCVPRRGIERLDLVLAHASSFQTGSQSAISGMNSGSI